MARLLAVGVAFLLIGLTAWWAIGQARLAAGGGEGPARRVWRLIAAYLASAAALLALATLLEWTWLAHVAGLWSAPLIAGSDAVSALVRQHVPRSLTGIVSWSIALAALAGFVLLHRFVLARTRG